MKNKKLFFGTSVVWKDRTIGLMIAPGAGNPIIVTIPSEFPDGEEGKLLTEARVSAEISSCFMTTFLSLAGGKNLGLIKFQYHAVVDVIDETAN
jgi:hypothetical protein